MGAGSVKIDPGMSTQCQSVHVSCRSMKTCPKCGKAKPLDEFSQNRSRPDGRQHRCRACAAAYYEANRERVAEYGRRYREANPEKIRQYRDVNREKLAERKRRHYEANREKLAELNRQYWAANREKLIEQQHQYREANSKHVRERDRRWHEANREKLAEQGRQRRAELKAAVFAHYGEACACCGATDQLTIDHVGGLDGGGGTSGGNRLYMWLRRSGFPDGYQTLCHSCNASKHTGDRCRLHARSAVA